MAGRKKIGYGKGKMRWATTKTGQDLGVNYIRHYLLFANEDKVTPWCVVTKLTGSRLWFQRFHIRINLTK